MSYPAKVASSPYIYTDKMPPPMGRGEGGRKDVTNN